jgi:hypothetical protein
MKKKYFKVQKGYGADDYITIDESELPTAIRAQVTGKVALFTEGTVSGNHIISITPDFNRMMGWNRNYQLSGEDYSYIGNKLITECRNMLEEAKLQASAQLGSCPSNPQLKSGF